MKALLLIITALLCTCGSPPRKPVRADDPAPMEIEISPEDMRALEELIEYIEGPMIEIA